MTIRERYISNVLFQETDRIPFFPGQPRESTLKVWHTQGLPENEHWYSNLTKKLGIECEWLYSDINPGVNFRMIPEFDEKIIEKKEHTLIVQDWKGNINEISDEYDIRYLRDPIDFVTRRWIKCPVDSWEDWEQMKERYDPSEPKRFPDDFDDRCELLKNQNRVVSVKFNGPFMQLREWLGFEGLCTAFINHPDMIKDMIHFYEEFIARLLETILSKVKLDYVHISEDMAYKEKSMISPQMAREFLMSTWIEWCEIVHEAGCPIYDMDSDGYVGELIPLWIEAGFQINDPVEVAAGNDIVAFRENFGEKMAYMGGIDKRIISKGGDTIRNELERLRPAIRSRGYIPSCDHGIPGDISWVSMIDYCQFLAQETGWL